MGKKNSSIIERKGIHVLNDFLMDSDLISPFLNVGDKEPSWDGNLYLYKKESQKIEELKAKIATQIKSREGAFEKVEKFCIKKTHLENYMKDGGVIYLRPVYKTKNDYRIYIKPLLPITIKEFLKDSPKNKNSISVEFIQLNDCTHMLNLLNFYIDNKPHQGNVFLNDLITEFPLNRKLVYKGFGKNNPFDLFFSNTGFFYIEDDDTKALLPTAIKVGSLSIEREINISVNGKVYFNSIQYEKNHNSKNEITIILNTALRIEFDKNNLQFNFKLKETDDSTIQDILTAIDFFNDLNEFKKFFIDDKEVFPQDITINFEFPDISYWRNLLKLLETLKIETNKITKGYYSKNKRTFEDLYRVLYKKGKITFNENVEKHSIKLYEINENIIILYFIQNSDKTYLGNDFFSEINDNNTYSVLIKNQRYICSRYLALAQILYKKHYDLVKPLVLHKDTVLKNLYKEFRAEIIGEYNEFILFLINGFDKYNNNEVLNMAEEISNFIKERNNDEQMEEILIINRFQIYRRRRELNDKEISVLIELKEKHKNDNIFQCCIAILMESKELSYFLKKLEFEDLKNLKSWPIWKLREKKN